MSDDLSALTVGRVRAALEGVPDDVTVLVWENGDKCWASTVEITFDDDGNIVEVVLG